MPRPFRPGPWILALCLGGGATALYANQAAADRAPDAYASLDRFARILTDIEQHYVDDIDEERLVEAAIEGMVSELDPHSRWLDAQAYQNLRADTAGQYEGIGVEVDVVDTGVQVVRVMSGGPAARDGLRPDDVITAIDGQSIAGFELDQVSRILRGARGTAVALTVERAGWAQPKELRTVRDRIDVPSVEAGVLPGQIAYVRLTGFQHDCARHLEKALREQQRAGATKGLVLDLRDNPGGLMEEAVKIVDLFVDAGPIVSTRGRTEGEQLHTASRGGFGEDLPIAVLVNGDSASASEVVTGALQDLERAVVVGTHTFGKGSVQTLFQRGDGALKLTIARYYTPAGTPVAPDQGRTPDVVVPYPAVNDPLGELQARVASLSAPPEERAELLGLIANLPLDELPTTRLPWDRPLADRVQSDPQLRAALTQLGVAP